MEKSSKHKVQKERPGGRKVSISSLDGLVVRRTVDRVEGINDALTRIFLVKHRFKCDNSDSDAKSSRKLHSVKAVAPVLRIRAVDYVF